MPDFDDLVPGAHKQAADAQEHETRIWEQASQNARHVMAEAEQVGRDAARVLADGGVPTVPVIEFSPGLFGRTRARVVERAWVLRSGVLSTDGVLLRNLPMTGAEAVQERAGEAREQQQRALRRAGIREDGRLILGPAVPGLRTETNQVVTLWEGQLNFLPINNGALTLSPSEDRPQPPSEDRPQRRSLAGPEPFAALIAAQVAALLEQHP